MFSILFGVQLLLLPLTNRAELKTRSRKTKASSPSLWETNNPPLWTPPLLRQTPRQWDPKQCRRNLPWEPGKLFSLYVSWPWCFWFHTWWLVSNLSFFLSLPGATGEQKNTSKRVRTMTASMVFTVLCSLTHTCSLVSLFSGCVSLHRFSKEVSKLHQKGKGWFHESIRESSIQESHLSASLHWTKRAWCVFCFFFFANHWIAHLWVCSQNLSIPRQWRYSTLNWTTPPSISKNWFVSSSPFTTQQHK